MAKQYLKNRKIILHTDRAKTYQMRIEGMLHDSVRHCKKRIKVNGKWVWKNPVYSKVVSHKLPNGGSIKVRSSSQIIDRTWRSIRSHLSGYSKRPGASSFASRVRSAQWVYWNRNKGLWTETATLLKELKYHWVPIIEGCILFKGHRWSGEMSMIASRARRCMLCLFP